MIYKYKYTDSNGFHSYEFTIDNVYLHIKMNFLKLNHESWISTSYFIKNNSVEWPEHEYELSSLEFKKYIEKMFKLKAFW